MLKKVMRQPTCRPMMRPRGMPNIMATEEPVTTMLKATERYLSGTMRTAMGEMTDQNTACVHATPMRESMSMA